MFWVGKIQEAIDFIEGNLFEPINVETVGKAINYAPSSFSNFFSAVVGYSVGEYIRFRRLSVAAEHLVKDEISVTDIAFKCGFETVESFSKSFKRLFGYAPSQFAESIIKYTKFSPITINFSLNGGFNMEELNKEIELDPNNATLYIQRGHTYNNLGQYGKAIENYSKAIEINPTQGYFDRAVTYGNKGEYEKVVEDITKAIEFESNDINVALAYINRAVAHFYLGENDKSVEDFDKSIEFATDLAQTYIWRANAYRHDLRRADKAIEDLTKAIELNSEHGCLYLDLVELYKELKKQGDDEFTQHENEIAACTKAIEFYPNNIQSYISRAELYRELKQYENALADYTKAIELDPNNNTEKYLNHAYISENMGIYRSRAHIYYILKRYDKSLKDNLKALEFEPQNVWIHYGIAGCYQKMKQHDKVVEVLTNMIEFTGDWPYPYHGRALSYHVELKQLDKAIEDYKKAIEIQPTNLMFQFDFARCYEDFKQYDKAIEVYTTIIGISPNNVYAYRTRADHYHHNLKQYDKALEDYNKAIEFTPMFGWTYIERAGVYEKLGRHDKAEADYNKAMELKNSDFGLKRHDMALRDYTKELFDNR